MANASSPTQAVVLASYGTTRDDARATCLDPVSDALEQAFPGWLVTRAYTSRKVRRALDARGEHVASVTEALHVLLALGVRRVVVQSGHVVPGASFDGAGAALGKCGRLFDEAAVGSPLLSDGSDAFCLAEAVCERYPREAGAALVLVGHGGGEKGDGLFAQVERAAHALGRTDVLVGTLHGEAGRARVLEGLGSGAAGDARLVRLAPLMMCAGAHAHRDMAGPDPASWESSLVAAGFEVEPLQVGLGELPAVRELVVRHAREAASGMPAAPTDPGASA